MRDLIVLSLAALLAACGDSAPPPALRAATQGSLGAGAPLWDDPQNTPHPAFGFATLSSPPAATNLPEGWAPIPPRPLPASITALTHVAGAPSRVDTGAGIALFGSLAIVPGFGDPSHIVSVADPANPRRLGRIDEEGHRGAATIAYPDGRLLALFSTDEDIRVWEITDPRDPRPLRALRPAQGSHKVGVVPGTPIVYNAASAGGDNVESRARGVTEIFDLSDPDRPVHVQDFPNGYSCHHIHFWNRPERNRYRALCAGLEYTQIWDTADPRNPKIIVSIPVHHGVPGTPSAAVTPVVFSHTSILNRDGTVLVVGDENGGGGLPPGCVASAETPAATASVPVGAIWFYDVTDERNPLLLGWYSASRDPTVMSAFGTCTAHHGRLVPDPQRDLLAMAFYSAGVMVVDFTDPTHVRALAQFADSSNTWEVWYNQGYLFTGDLARGFDVLTFD